MAVLALSISCEGNTIFFSMILKRTLADSRPIS